MIQMTFWTILLFFFCYANAFQQRQQVFGFVLLMWSPFKTECGRNSKSGVISALTFLQPTFTTAVFNSLQQPTLTTMMMHWCQSSLISQLMRVRASPLTPVFLYSHPDFWDSLPVKQNVCLSKSLNYNENKTQLTAKERTPKNRP